MATLIGKQRRLAEIINQQSGRTVIVPVDDSLISGPTNGLEHLHSKVLQIASAKPDAVIGFQGVFSKYADTFLGISQILNLTASTTLTSHTKKVLVGSVEQAVQLGVQAVAVHVNVSSRYESEMLATLGLISRACETMGMPLMAIMYPRTESDSGDNNYLDLRQESPDQYSRLVAHAARIAMELGADLIKTQYTGTQGSFQFVTESCAPVPVVIAGGPLMPLEEMLEMAYAAVLGGASGVSFGRNVFGRTNSTLCIEAIKLIIHKGISPNQALNQIQDIFRT